jgi:hypothetical protein
MFKSLEAGYQSLPYKTRMYTKVVACTPLSRKKTWTLTLQEHKAKFARKGEVSSLCPMCRKETENTAHFILQCARLQEVRKPFMDKVLSYLETNENLTPYVTDLLEDQHMLQLLIDCTQFDFIPLKERSYLETLSRGLCYKLYQQRKVVAWGGGGCIGCTCTPLSRKKNLHLQCTCF